MPKGRAPWRHWGPYLSERAWGTVREDYSPDGAAWEYFPHEHANKRAYRWNEEGLGGLSDDQQLLCFGFAFWNGRDPILKERVFGLTGNQGNHGEDAKEYWWYLDSTPTHSWMRWRYMYPQEEFPYQDLVDVNHARGREQPEYELVDTGIFDQSRYWEITAEYAKGGPEDILIRLAIRNYGPDPATLHVLPTLWFRNTWAWKLDDRRPRLRAQAGAIVAEHHTLGRRILAAEDPPETLFCENETNFKKVFGSDIQVPYPKDGINDHVILGAATVNPAQTGTKAAFHHQLTVPAGQTRIIRLRLTDGEPSFDSGFDELMSRREREADEYYAQVIPTSIPPEQAAVMRQALAGMLWSKQFYHYDVRRWIEGDPRQPAPPTTRLRGRNSRWMHLHNRDVLSMPDKWEYPWYAAWDLAFHCVSLARIDPEFAKFQLVLMCREWYMHPNGQLPAYEWALDDVNPPVHAWAALRVFEIAGDHDYDFLKRVFHKLLLNFTWWVNQNDREGRNVFQGGFLGLDNVGPFDRSRGLPMGGRLDQSDGTAWMAHYCLMMLELSLTLALHDPSYQDIATKFYEHFAMIALAINQQGLWDEIDGFYYDVLRLEGSAERDRVPLRARSIVGLVPLFAVSVIEPGSYSHLQDYTKRTGWYTTNQPEVSEVINERADGRQLLAVVKPDRLRTILRYVLDPDEMLSPFGVRSLSRRHRADPLQVEVGDTVYRLDYEPGESVTDMFGGNSNWRGPIWFPVNYLLVWSLRRYHRYCGPEFKVECPTGSGVRLNLNEVADEIARRLVSIFLEQDGHRPLHGDRTFFDCSPPWRDLIPFYEFFHGDTGAGLGASHQTGWTALVAELIHDLDPTGRQP